MWCLSTHHHVLQAPNLMLPTKKPEVSSDPDIEDPVHRLHLWSPKWEWEYSSWVGRKCQNVCTHTGTHKRTYIYVQRYAYVCMSECCCLVAKSCLTFCGPMDISTPCFPVLHYLWSLLELMSIESVMLSNPLILCCPSSPSTFNLSQHQGLFQWTTSLHQVAHLLELQLQL